MSVYAGPKIPTSGLVLCLDAANTKSYPGSGNTWYDSSGAGNHMTLFNSPAFSSANNGVLQFDGVTQYGSIVGLNYSTSTFTIVGAARYSGTTKGRVITSVTNNWLFGHYSGATERYYAEGWIYQAGANDNNWRIYAATENYAADLRSFYVNNEAKAIDSTLGSQGFNGLSIGRWGTGAGSQFSTCEVSYIAIYNRILNTDELSQNFNAIRGRYGL